MVRLIGVKRIAVAMDSQRTREERGSLCANGVAGSVEPATPHGVGILAEEHKFYVLGFIPADAIRLRKEVWFVKLTQEQIDTVARAGRLK